MSKESKKPSRQQLRGKVLSFNTSKKGHIDGALLESEAGIAQVNFRKSDGHSIVESMPVGSTVELTVALETREGAHPIYVIDEHDAEASGRIVRFNYALHGEVNGYHLDEGTFVHLRPKDANRVELAIGARVKAVGSRHAGKDVVVIAARSLERLDVAT